VQKLPIELDKAWDFFSDPQNLQAITPADLGFKIVSQHHGEKMYAGQIIEYYVSPVLHIPVYWMTEITHVEDKRYFIDEQRFGPYSLWHHEHHFKEVTGGVEMTDIVNYKLPFGFFGSLLHSLFVRKQIKEVFDYRYNVLEKQFGKMIGLRN